MFRDTSPSDMSHKKIGVGSIIKVNHPPHCLIVATGKMEIGLVDMKTFTLFERQVIVQDINFLSSNEVRELVDQTIGHELQWTFSDFELDPKGLKVIEK